MSDTCWVEAGSSDFPPRLSAHWWAFALRGVVAVALGLLAFLWPGITLAVLLGLFAGYLAMDGVLGLVAAARALREHSSFWPFLFEAVADWLAAAIALLWPGLTLFALLYLAAAWAVVSGVFLMVGATRINGTVHGRSLLIAGGLVSTVWGVLLFVWPIAGLLALAWWFGAYAILFGGVLIATGLRLRRMAHA